MRVIVSNKGKNDNRLKSVQSDLSPIIIFSTKRMPRKNQKALQRKATLHLTDARHGGRAVMLETLRNQYKVRTLACEGGATLFRALLAENLIDHVGVRVAPFMFGGGTAARAAV